MVGHYRVIYTPKEEEIPELLGKEHTYAFLYNGDKDNPSIEMYIDDKLITDVVIDNFNFFGPCEEIREECTLRNFSQTVSTIDFDDPNIYVLQDVDITGIYVFTECITPEIIKYLSLINQS